MSWLSAFFRELLSLFVDDVPFTAAIVVWLVIATVGLPRLAIDARWDAPLLAAGCALLLVVSARWTALRHCRRLEARV